MNSPSLAQITPDATLGAEGSIVNPATINGLPSDRIDGGAIRGSNLFHSFSEFNIREGTGAYFTNPAGIANILTRVTGNNPSNIFGTLGVLGNANLFLLNPNGMIFGPNARLDLRGSFFGSSASSVVFNGFEFSTVNPQAPPLLTVNVPIGLGFRENPGAIINQSRATSLLPILPSIIPFPPSVGLEVVRGQTLALLGGDLRLESGNLTAYQGNILLGSVAGSGVVNLNLAPTNLILDYQNIQNFGNIQLSSGALINVSGLGGGRVEIRGGNVNISGTRILSLTLGPENGRGIDIRANTLWAGQGSLISASTFANGNGGDLNIQATDSVELSGLGLERFGQFVNSIITEGTVNAFDPNLLLITGTGLGIAKAGDIRIETRRLVMRDGATMGGATVGVGDGGNITLKADTVEMVSSGIYNGSFKGSIGNGGDITIEDVSSLTLREGSVLLAATLGDGKSGNITVNAKSSVELTGNPPGFPFVTVIATSATVGTGNAGDITINTGRLNISGGAAIDSSSGATLGETLFSTSGGLGGNLTINAQESIEIEGFSEILANGSRNLSGISAVTTTSSPGGDIIINTPNLIVRDGGIITTATLSAGDAGTIAINAQEIEVIGNRNNSQFLGRIEAASINFGLVAAKDMGDAGSLTLNADRLIVRDGGIINVQSLGGEGKAGTIDIFARAIALDNGGRIDANIDSGGGGNIELRAETIELRRGSAIVTNARSSTGGNIKLDSNILVALPGENSDITANATTGAGGTVTINVPNIFGIAGITREQIRDQLGLTDEEFAALKMNPTKLLLSNDIAAISQQAGPTLQGTVTFSSSGINPAQGLVELPQNLVDSDSLMAANSCVQGEMSVFVITGRGGLPEDPRQALRSQVILPDLRPNADNPVATNTRTTAPPQRTQPEKNEEFPEIVEATGWVVNAQGNIELVANSSEMNRNFGNYRRDCQVLNQDDR